MNDELIEVGLNYDNTKGYAERITCSNCNWSKTIYVPFKVKIKDYLVNKRCERCQCIEVLY